MKHLLLLLTYVCIARNAWGLGFHGTGDNEATARNEALNKCRAKWVWCYITRCDS